jgi:hypothetical protein
MDDVKVVCSILSLFRVETVLMLRMVVLMVYVHSRFHE